MDNSKSTTTTRRTTVRIGGKRIRLTTKDGVTVAKPAPIEEWRLQAEAVRRLSDMPECAATAAAVKPGTFTFAADFNAGKRDATKAKATGVKAGETDLRVYGYAARLLLIEYKNAEGRLSKDQVARHALLRALGYRVEVIKASTPEECASASVALVRGWLVGNENNSTKCDKAA